MQLDYIHESLEMQQNQFPAVLKNPVYIGRIYLPAYKDEEATYVNGLHESLISESLFYQVQEIIDGRRRPYMPSSIMKREELPLRGYLICKGCGTNLTGSASKGNVWKFWKMSFTRGQEKIFR